MARSRRLSKKARGRIPKIVWAIVDRDGYVFGSFYETQEQAKEDAWGFRFYPHEICAYKLVPKSQQPKRKDES